MANQAEGFNHFAVHQNVDLGQVVGSICNNVIIHRAVSARERFQLVIKVIDDLCHRQFIIQNLTAFAEKSLRLKNAATAVAQLDQVADIFGRTHDLQLCNWLANCSHL